MSLSENNWRQVVEALTCPLNRSMTMVEHSCDEWELFRNPDLLINHYVKFGGAEAFAKRRGLYLEPEYQI
ncbi:MAG: hypothetical protein A3C58_01045 [Candidatus Staskawiczbacteria bacterium RIFCSPHIGHO2_02_FULL_34_10]|uniref:Uncharacterized protein n=1 Tax=Candidatus Staskawiczbacteria bacterium RIFCSPHIGHO2_02_FULL_34_10 TaxID=1802205 RepID=A0A1G2HYT4_9BACT|nr:MAG: hypothetical protein A3C58_01045 [Candidatus Staskawiczbacteria bacterium RIFCSPHIGHO2_02_FULL_34_10]